MKKGVATLLCAVFLSACAHSSHVIPATNSQSQGQPRQKQTIAATTIWVAPQPTGNDANSGKSPDQPFATITKAASVAGPGDVVTVADGTYSGVTVGHIMVDVTNSGVAGNPITFRAAHNGQAKIAGDAQTTADCVSVDPNVSFVNIIGFDIGGCNVSGITLDQGNTDISITNNTIHNIGENSNCTQNDGFSGVYWGPGTANIVIDSNTIHDVGRSCSGWLSDHLMYGHGHNITIINNVLYNAHSGWEIQVTGDAPPDGPGWFIANNTFGPANPTYGGFNVIGDIIIWKDGAPGAVMPSNLHIDNNVFYNSPSGYGIDGNLYAGDKSQLLINNNLFNNVTNADPADDHTVYPTGGAAAFTPSGNIYATDPAFVNAAGNDFHLQSTSPAAGAGIEDGYATYDFDGVTRPNPPSIGAFEQRSVPQIDKFVATQGHLNAGPYTSTTSTVTPTNAGEPVFAFFSANANGANPPPSAPSGWTLVGSYQAAANHYAFGVLYQRSTPTTQGEVGSSIAPVSITWTSSGGTDMNTALFTLTSGGVVQTAGSGGTATSVTDTLASAPLQNNFGMIFFSAFSGNQTVSAPAGWTLKSSVNPGLSEQQIYTTTFASGAPAAYSLSEPTSADLGALTVEFGNQHQAMATRRLTR